MVAVRGIVMLIEVLRVGSKEISQKQRCSVLWENLVLPHKLENFQVAEDVYLAKGTRQGRRPIKACTDTQLPSGHSNNVQQEQLISHLINIGINTYFIWPNIKPAL
jgi:hypothetical protein